MKTIKYDITAALATFSAVIGSLAFIFFWIRGTILIVFGGQDLFAAITWIVFITCMLYFMSLLTSKALITSNIPLIQKLTLLAIDIVAVGLTCFSFAMSVNLTVSIVVGILSVIGFITGFRIDFDEFVSKRRKKCVKIGLQSFDLMI